MGRTREVKNPKTCHERALGLLAVRPRSRREMQTRLLRAGFEADEVEDVLARLERVQLLDDEQFARDLAQHAYAVKRSGTRAVRASLLAKGVDRGTVELITDEYEDGEGRRAEELASERASRMQVLDPVTAHRRLVNFLIRRGHDPREARAAASKALAERLEDA